MAEWLVKGVALAGAAFFVVTGAWAFADPTSFYAQVATFPPYNRHFLHDVGVFSLGIGAALVLGLTRWPALRVVLWAAALAAALHAVSHVIDRHLGGRASDPLALSVVAAVLIAAALLATRRTHPPTEVRSHATASPPARLRGDRAARTAQPD